MVYIQMPLTATILAYQFKIVTARMLTRLVRMVLWTFTYTVPRSYARIFDLTSLRKTL